MGKAKAETKRVAKKAPRVKSARKLADFCTTLAEERYRYTVAWSEEDEAFVGRVSEFPSLAAHGSTQEEALKEIRSVVAFVLVDLEEEGQEPPAPLEGRHYSGRINLRMPSHLHRALAIEASEEGVSLNQLMILKLSRGALV